MLISVTATPAATTSNSKLLYQDHDTPNGWVRGFDPRIGHPLVNRYVCHGGDGQPHGAPTTLTTLGYDMPRLGFGVYQNYTTHESVLEAFRAGYR